MPTDNQTKVIGIAIGILNDALDEDSEEIVKKMLKGVADIIT